MVSVTVHCTDGFPVYRQKAGGNETLSKETTRWLQVIHTGHRGLEPSSLVGGLPVPFLTCLSPEVCCQTSPSVMKLL